MLATIGQQAAFEQGRQQMELLAGLSVTTKAVETHGRRHRSRYRNPPATRTRPGPATDFTDSLGATDSYPLRGDGRHQGSRGA
jgi:hypothetical protein